MDNIVLVIASVPWRQEHLERLLKKVDTQTRRPDRIELVLDGYGEALVDVPTGTWQHIYPEQEGPIRRWQIADAHRENDWLLFFDDDFTMGPKYIEQTVEAQKELGTDALSWNGITERDYIRWDVSYDAELELGVMGSGTSMIRAGLLHDCTHNLRARAAMVLPNPDDELAVCWFMRTMHGTRFWRPRGIADCYEVAEASNDPRSLRHRNERARHFKDLGWNPWA